MVHLSFPFTYTALPSQINYLWLLSCVRDCNTGIFQCLTLCIDLFPYFRCRMWLERASMECCRCVMWPGSAMRVSWWLGWRTSLNRNSSTHWRTLESFSGPNCWSLHYRRQPLSLFSWWPLITMLLEIHSVGWPFDQCALALRLNYSTPFLFSPCSSSLNPSWHCPMILRTSFWASPA